MDWSNIFQEMIRKDNHKKTINQAHADLDNKAAEFNKKFWENYND